MEHKVNIISTRDRAVPDCSCGDLPYRQFFGNRRTANAKEHIFKHLETSFKVAEERDYQVKVNDLKCPICEAKLELNKDDIMLIEEKDPSVVNCENNHYFDAYSSRGSLHLFLLEENGPYSTS